MSIHLHRTRQWTAWVLGGLALSPLALSFGSPTHPTHLSPVTGRLTIDGQPAGDITLCLDSDGRHAAYGTMNADGTFRLSSMTWIDEGALPGHYRGHLYTHQGGPVVAQKYRDVNTSGIDVDVASGWNDFRIDLH